MTLRSSFVKSVRLARVSSAPTSALSLELLAGHRLDLMLDVNVEGDVQDMVGFVIGQSRSWSFRLISLTRPVKVDQAS
jgi:hypothetical protein